jgi:hypothetical protein
MIAIRLSLERVQQIWSKVPSVAALCHMIAHSASRVYRIALCIDNIRVIGTRVLADSRLKASRT